VVLTLLLSVGIGWVLRNTVFWSSVSLANYNAVHVGMSESKVTAILGPPGDYRTGRTMGSDAEVDVQWPRGGLTSRIEEWDSNWAMVLVGFDESGRVTGKSYFPWKPDLRSGRNRLEELKNFVVRLWHRLFG
jgi:hypothetical protein